MQQLEDARAGHYSVSNSGLAWPSRLWDLICNEPQVTHPLWAALSHTHFKIQVSLYS